MRDWYDLEECYLTEKGKDLIEKLAQAGLDQKLAKELAHELIANSELYNLEDEENHG